MQLAIGREGIGLELARSARSACLTLTELSATLPGVRFPVDVSGGVQRFRHRRGELQKILLELPIRSLERWAAPRLRGIVSVRAPDVWVAASDACATVCVCAPESQIESATAATQSPGPAIVAFELHAIADDEDLVFVVEQARGGNLPAPPTAIAIACVEAALEGMAERAGAVFVLRRPTRGLLRSLLPAAGARVPATQEVRWAAMSAHGDTWLLHAARGALAHVPTERALRALETARLVARADDALVAGDVVEARSGYLEALERAPRHPEIARRIVEIDARAGGRAEAALALLAEVRGGRTGAAGSPSVAERELFGTTPGELLAEVGDTAAALASLERVGDSDPAPGIAARAYETAASLTRDAEASAAWLDRALARAPRATTPRYARVARRLQLGRIEDALSDVEHLEALARGGRAKHAVWLRAGRAWQAAGLQGRAGPLFERALRFAPDDPGALAGLGRALVDEGRAARGIAVLTRALRSADGRGEPSSAIILELARAIAENLDDLPNAIARVAGIPPEAEEAPVARGLEGRWRARLGDFAGADLAFARLREYVASLPPGSDHPSGSLLASMLRDAADLHRRESHDSLAAQRYLAVALRLRPHDDELLRAYREIGAELRGGPPTDPRPAAPPPPAAPRPAAPPPAAPAPPLPDETSEASREARVDELTRRLQADARDDEAADELFALLEVLERGHELVALVSARLEEASPERRAFLAPRARAALQRLASKAEASGRADEASLFRDAVRLLVPE